MSWKPATIKEEQLSKISITLLKSLMVILPKFDYHVLTINQQK